jgi:probable F420-dependent oxidoreductase
MKFNINFPNSNHVKAMYPPEWERALQPADQARGLRLAEELGFSKILMPEHFGIPASQVDLSGDHFPQTTTALGFVAGVTSRIKLSSYITILPLQHPLIHAKMWATLDWLSGGRAVMMAAVGWLKEEYEMVNLPFHERGAMCDEYVAAMIELWTKDSASFEGKYVNFRDVAASPKPVQKPGIPIYFGGDAPAVLRRVARWGTGWAPFQTPPGEIPARLEAIRSQAEYHGRPIEVMYPIYMLNFGEGHAVKGDAAAEGLSEAQQLIDQLGYLQSLGVTETEVPRPALRDFEEYADWMRWIAAEVMPRVQ